MTDKATLEMLNPFLAKGKTSVVVGSSGVGKSTLINQLIGQEILKTQSIREDDGKGRHTTSSRYLFVSPGGGMVIDTPGMREIQMADQEEGLQRSFEDVEILFAQCRFRDCRHQSEPGCAVHAALESGSLDQSRWASYLKLLGEIRHYQRKVDKSLASEDRKRWKKIHKDVRERMKLKGR